MNDAGFQSYDDVFSESECDTCLEELRLPEVMRSRAGARHLLSVALVSRLAGDRRLRQIACDALGQRATPFRATLFDKSGSANWSVPWHQDTALPLRTRFESPGWGPWSVKAGVAYAHAPTEALERIIALRVHLDESTMSNGPLRVIPESHRFGVLSDTQVGEIAHATSAMNCLVAKGGVLAMRPLLIHSSLRVTGSGFRRVLHIEYAPDIEVMPGIFLAAA